MVDFTLPFYILTGDLTGISQVVEGDLIYTKESHPGEATSVGTSEVGLTNSSEIDICPEAIPEENIQSVKVCYKPTCSYTENVPSHMPIPAPLFLL